MSTITVAIDIPLITLNSRSGAFWNCQKSSRKPPDDTNPSCSTTPR
jgi:hypothetical protein